MFAKLIYYVDDDKLVGKYVDVKPFKYAHSGFSIYDNMYKRGLDAQRSVT